MAADENTDYWPTKGWRTASPESQGVDSNLLENMLNTIWEKDLDIESVLVVRNGYIVLDAYRNPSDANDTSNLFSCTKSVTSALIGIAIDKGYIAEDSKTPGRTSASDWNNSIKLVKLAQIQA